MVCHDPSSGVPIQQWYEPKVLPACPAHTNTTFKIFCKKNLSHYVVLDLLVSKHALADIQHKFVKKCWEKEKDE